MWEHLPRATPTPPLAIVELGPDGIRGADVVLYKIWLDSVPELTVNLPAGVGVERVEGLAARGRCSGCCRLAWANGSRPVRSSP